MNDQIELVGRFGAALGQVGWLLVLMGLMDSEWAHIDTIGNEAMTEYGLENATSGILGLNEWCIGGIDVTVPDSSEENMQVYAKDQLCFSCEFPAFRKSGRTVVWRQLGAEGGGPGAFVHDSPPG